MTEMDLGVSGEDRDFVVGVTNPHLINTDVLEAEVRCIGGPDFTARLYPVGPDTWEFAIATTTHTARGRVPACDLDLHPLEFRWRYVEAAVASLRRLIA